MRDIAIHILSIVVLLCVATEADAWRRPRDLLGGGGTNYSDKLNTQTGLRTGQYAGEHLLVGFYGNGSYATVIQNAPFVGATNGYGNGLGLAIEYQHHSLLFQAGFGIRYQKLKTGVGDTTLWKYNVSDSWTGQRDTFHYDMQFDFYRRTDRSSLFYFDIPLLVGQAFDYSIFKGTPYYLAGIRMQMAWIGATQVDLTGSTQAVYDRYFGIFRKMDNHGMRKDVPINKKEEALKLRFDMLAHLEIGWEWSNPQPEGYRIRNVFDWRIRVAAFADISLPNVVRDSQGPLCYVPDASKWDFPTYQFKHAFASESFKPYQLRNVYAGIRVTVLIGVLFKEKCIICGPYGDERDPGTKHW